MSRAETLKNPTIDKSHPKEKFQIKVPGYTIPIFLGLAYNFPGEVVSENPRLVAERVSDMSPVMVSLNELADLGISAEKKLQGASQGQILPLLTLRNKIRNQHEERKHIFIQKYPSFKQSLEAIEKDFLLLSREREKFSSPEYPFSCKGYAELDSGIFEVGFIEHALPGLLRDKAGVDLAKPVDTVDQLSEKYNIFLLEANKKQRENGTVRRVQNMHGLMMAYKVDDDIEGVKIDRLLGMPNLTGLNECNPNHSENDVSLKDLKREYIQIASQGGIPSTILRTILYAADIKGKYKDSKSAKKHDPTDDLYYLSKHFGPVGFPENSNTLRHELESSGVLSSLFG